MHLNISTPTFNIQKKRNHYSHEMRHMVIVNLFQSSFPFCGMKQAKITK